MVDVKKTANVVTTIKSDIDGEKVLQAQRGGNVGVPAVVEVEIRTAHEMFSVTIEVTEDGRVTSKEKHVYPGLGKDNDGSS